MPIGKRRFAAIGAVLIGALALSACKSQTLHTGSIAQDGYRTRHPIIITEAPETLDIPVGTATRSLSPALSDKIQAFAADARRRGDGGIEILVPSGSANETAAMYVARQVRGAVARAGIGDAQVVAHSYAVDDPDALAPVRISYLRMKAVVDRCGVWRDNIAHDFDNRGYDEFGCATQSNLAVMVADPTDLLYPRATRPGDPMRRDTVYEKFRKGEKPYTDYGDETSVSEVSGG